MTYKATYKCRLCGATYQNGATTGEELATLNIFRLAAGLQGPRSPKMNEVHNCGGDHAGSFGLADFQGWEAVEDG